MPRRLPFNGQFSHAREMRCGRDYEKKWRRPLVWVLIMVRAGGQGSDIDEDRRADRFTLPEFQSHESAVLPRCFARP